MPKFICKCSNIINCSNIPNENEYHLISDVEVDGYGKQVNLVEFTLNSTMVLSCRNPRRWGKNS